MIKLRISFISNIFCNYSGKLKYRTSKIQDALENKIKILSRQIIDIMHSLTRCFFFFAVGIDLKNIFLFHISNIPQSGTYCNSCKARDEITKCWHIKKIQKTYKRILCSIHISQENMRKYSFRLKEHALNFRC